MSGCSSSGPAATDLDPQGDIAIHDPVLYTGEDGEPWYIYSTGDLRIGFGAPQIRKSTDEGKTWEYVGTAWDASTRPEWVYDAVPGVENFWAPDLVKHGDTYYLYYAASTFGANTSAIGLATNETLDPDSPDYEWVDQGMVVRSVAGEDNFNAIDPSVITAQDGTPWMAFGSFWGGIQLIQLEWPSGLAAPGAEPTRIASRIGAPNAIEAPQLYYHDGYYYLFVSRDSCCKGVDSTYNIAVGRSKEVTGPYVGPDGRDMTLDGGMQLLSENGDMIGPGGQSVSGDDYLTYHWYDGANGGAFRVGIRQLAWDKDGWPVAWTSNELAERPST